MSARTLLIVVSVFDLAIACGIGIPRIENGEWANKDSIYANCEKCYSGNEEEIRNCKTLYNRTAENQIVQIEEQRNKALSYIQSMIKEVRRLRITHAELCYFPKKYPDCQKSKDTLEVIINLNKNEIRNLDVKTLTKYETFLRSLKERKKDVVQFQNLLLTRPKELKARNVTLSLLNTIPFARIEDRIVNADHWLYLFGQYSAFVEGCESYEVFKIIAESNTLLNVIFISQSEYGPYNRPVNGGTFFTDVSYASVKKGISACLLLKGEEEKIAYGNDHIFTEGVQNTIWALTRLYEKEVLGEVTEEERKMKENEFHSELGLKYIKPIINNLIRYDRHTRRELSFGTQTGEMFIKLKRIYDLP